MLSVDHSCVHSVVIPQKAKKLSTSQAIVIHRVKVICQNWWSIIDRSNWYYSATLVPQNIRHQAALPGEYDKEWCLLNTATMAIFVFRSRRRSHCLSIDILGR